MAAPPLLSLRDVFVTFGGAPLFTGVTTWIARGDKTGLVGRNGSGKSTLLKVMAGEMEVDSGEVFRQPGITIAYLPQDPPIDAPTLRDYVLRGLPPSEADQTYRADSLMMEMDLDPDRAPAGLSGGEARRVAIAQALVGEPDVVLLDEPTNHLDLPTILWLEEKLKAFAGALVVISHDRAFLNHITRQTLWLDRGQVRRSEKGFAHFEQWQDEMAAAEEAELARMDKKLEAEMHWLHRGVTARRKRNMGRLRALNDLRKDRAERQTGPRAAKFEIDSGQTSGALVAEAENISKSYGETIICQGFSTRIMRGDRVGLIGPNGAGKTTLLKMLTGQIDPDDGQIRLGTNLDTAIFDQRRAALDPARSVWDTLTDGSGDFVNVRGTPRHVVGYMRDFLFSDAQAHSPVKALSGGERNRLLLAKLLAKPSNLLILDEPTNDLDMDTLDLLEEVLADYDGTLLLVSHDRDFLDRLVTSVIAVEGQGELAEYPGGYSDYLIQRKAAKGSAAKGAAAKESEAAKDSKPKAQTKLSYKENRELDELPGRMEKLLAEQETLEATLADPTLYSRDAAAYQAASAQLDAVRHAQAEAEERWLGLEMKREELAAGRG